MPSYTLANASPHGTTHLGGLTGMFDHFTTDRVRETTRLEGARCLELGAGNGSIAIWLAEQVGPDGEVVATDLDTRHIPPHERVSVVHQDLLKDPLPPGPFDLIHTRLLLGHLQNREVLLAEICKQLAPGGTVLIEEFNLVDDKRTMPVLHAPKDQPGLPELWARFEKTRNELFFSSGADGSFGIRVHGLLMDAGMTDVKSVTYCESWQGGDPGSQHAAGALLQLRPKLLEHGFDADELEQLTAAVNNPEVHVAGRLLCSTSGHAPA
jgi:SAM-dependent methyltransferase